MIAVVFLNQSIMKSLRTEKRVRVCQSDRSSALSVYCRTCLGKEQLVTIFPDAEVEKRRSYELRLATGLEIKINDGLSQKICMSCLENVSLLLQFRKQSRNAEKALIQMAVDIQHGKAFKKKEKAEESNKKEERKVKQEELDNAAVEDSSFEDREFEEFNGYKMDVIKNDGEKVKKYVLVKKATAHNSKIARSLVKYKCSTCGKDLKTKATYRAHMRMHTNFCVCESCGKRCRNNYQLQEHRRARHGIGRIHTCAYCDYSSATKEALTIHERRHTGEKPYVCDHCGASFHRRSNLVQHIAIHLPEKNFQCDMCPKRVKSRRLLHSHKYEAHTRKRFAYLCGSCGNSFCRPYKVKLHARRVHGLPDAEHPPITRVEV